MTDFERVDYIRIKDKLIPLRNIIKLSRHENYLYFSYYQGCVAITDTACFQCIDKRVAHEYYKKIKRVMNREKDKQFFPIVRV